MALAARQGRGCLYESACLRDDMNPKISLAEGSAVRWSQTGDPLRTLIAFGEELFGPVHSIRQNCAEKDVGNSSGA